MTKILSDKVYTFTFDFADKVIFFQQCIAVTAMNNTSRRHNTIFIDNGDEDQQIFSIACQS